MSRTKRILIVSFLHFELFLLIFVPFKASDTAFILDMDMRSRYCSNCL